MSRKYKFGNSSKQYFISFAVVNWIDVFIRNEYKEILLDSWQYCQREKDLEIYGWCIMTSHVHMIIVSKGRPLDRFC
jgi:putative transposase